MQLLIEPWPKLFHNLRASRQTELTSRYPLHVVCKWLGNSASIAAKHYLQVTDAHYDVAVSAATRDAPNAGSNTEGVEGNKKAAQNPAHEVAQNAAQHAAALSRTESQETKEARKNRAVLLPNAFTCDSVRDSQVTLGGVELFANSRGNRPHQVTGGAKSGAVAGAVNSPATLLDVNLLRIIQSWPALSQKTRQQIMRLLDG